MRATATGLLVTLLCTGGCASNSEVKHHNVARTIMAALTVVAAGGTVAAAVISESKEKSLKDDVAAGRVNGQQYGQRDKEAERWNRFGRAGAFATGILAIGLGVVFEIESAERHQYEPVPVPHPPDLTPGHPEGPPVGPLTFRTTLQPTLGVYGRVPASLASASAPAAAHNLAIAK